MAKARPWVKKETTSVRPSRSVCSSIRCNFSGKGSVTPPRFLLVSGTGSPTFDTSVYWYGLEAVPVSRGSLGGGGGA